MRLKKTVNPTSLQASKIIETSPVIDLSDAQAMRILCILLTLEAIVSYRSVPRILGLFNTQMSFDLPWIPHFTSVINWSLRVGLGLLNQVTPVATPWVAIIDHSIDMGTKKALVVLRVSLDALSERGGAIQLKDCECIGLTISEKVTGETLQAELENIFTLAGNPAAIIKDGDSTLNKGVRLWSDKQENPVPAIYDIGHAMANALKIQFEKTPAYKRFVSLVGYGSKCLRQTELAFLIPPKLRNKGRFQSISKLGKWGEKMLMALAVKGNAKKGSTLEKLRTAFPCFSKSRGFIERFALTTKTVSQVMEVLKNKGLDKTSYKKCYELSKDLPRNSKVKKRLQDWLKQSFKVQKTMNSLPLLVSSDIIESLFGNFKHIIERSPQVDMNRSALLIPALCGQLNETIITKALNHASQKAILQWEVKNIPYTMRKKRHDFFSEKQHPKSGVK